MKDTVYLVINRQSVVRMTKNLPNLSRGEVPVRVEVTVDPNAFREPTLVRKIEIVDWRDGIDMEDVEFRGQFITSDEAAVIRTRRLEKMAGILRDQGWEVKNPEPEEWEGDREEPSGGTDQTR